MNGYLKYSRHSGKGGEGRHPGRSETKPRLNRGGALRSKSGERALQVNKERLREGAVLLGRRWRIELG